MQPEFQAADFSALPSRAGEEPEQPAASAQERRREERAALRDAQAQPREPELEQQES